MKTLFAIICILLFPIAANAQTNKNSESFTIESGIDALQGNFASDRDARLYVRRWQPFLRFEYRLNRWISNYTIIATEITSLGYEQNLEDNIRIRMDLNSSANLFVAQGINVHILSYRRFRLSAQIQYEFTFWDLRGDINSVVVNQKTTKFDITDDAREHVGAYYSWRRLHFVLRAEYDIWRFTPYAMFGWSILDANLTFHYDSEAREALALFGYETGSEDRDHYRGDAAIGMVGSEFRIWRGLSANLAAAAVPDKHGWIFAGRASLIWRL